MRIAAISDIHSNVFALDAVLSDIKRRDVDVIVNLGDMLYGPIAPKATYDLMMAHDMVTICGNQERQIFDATQQEIDANPTMQFILDELGNAPLEWMKTLPFSHQLTDDVFLCHGTPDDDLTYLLETIESGFALLRSDDDIIKLLGEQASKVILCGHTHTPRTVLLSSGQLVVNPGSVGLPAYTDNEPVVHSMENHSPHANYAILDSAALDSATLDSATLDSANSAWDVLNIKVAYDYAKAAAAASKRGRSDWVHYLTTGRGSASQ